MFKKLLMLNAPFTSKAYRALSYRQRLVMLGFGVASGLYFAHKSIKETKKSIDKIESSNSIAQKLEELTALQRQQIITSGQSLVTGLAVHYIGSCVVGKFVSPN